MRELAAEFVTREFVIEVEPEAEPECGADRKNLEVIAGGIERDTVAPSIRTPSRIPEAIVGVRQGASQTDRRLAYLSPNRA
jgi:hypothetical protein